MKKFIIGLVAGLMLGSSAIVMAQTMKSFPDVDPKAYYASSVSLMTDLGVINGYDNGNFGPNDSVSRAQVAAMLERYDESLKLLTKDYCENHKLQMGVMPTIDYQKLCVNRGYSVYETPSSN